MKSLIKVRGHFEKWIILLNSLILGWFCWMEAAAGNVKKEEQI